MAIAYHSFPSPSMGDDATGRYGTYRKRRFSIPLTHPFFCVRFSYVLSYVFHAGGLLLRVGELKSHGVFLVVWLCVGRSHAVFEDRAAYSDTGFVIPAR